MKDLLDEFMERGEKNVKMAMDKLNNEGEDEIIEEFMEKGEKTAKTAMNKLDERDR